MTYDDVLNSSVNGVVCHVCSSHWADNPRVFDRACASLAKYGYDVHLIATSPDFRDTYVSRGVTIHPLPKSPSRWARLRRHSQVARLAADLSPDLYHVHEPELLGAVVAVAGSCPVIWDVHEPYLENIATRDWIPKPLKPFVRVAWNWKERSLLRHCAAVVVATEWLAPRYHDLHERVVVIANFPRLPENLADSPSERRPNSLVFTGCLSPNRGVSGALQAMAILQRKGVVVSLDLAGPSYTREYVDDLMREADQLGIKNNVTYHGILSHKESKRLQQTCGIGLVSQLISPGSQVGYPVKMFEFMMHGLPIVYSNLPTFHLVAGESNAGIAVDPTQPQQIADAIERFVSDPNLAREMGKNGQRTILEHFNWDLEWRKLRELYDDLVGPPSAPFEQEKDR